MNTRSLILAAAILAAPGLFAQKLDLNLDHLIPLAKEHAVIDLNADQIKAALAVKEKSGEADKDKMKDKLSGLESLQVRTFEFEKEGAYKESDVESIRKQMSGPGWSRIISVKEKDEAVDIYMLTREGKAAGFRVLAAEPRELTIVNVSGSITVNDLQALVNSSITYDLAALQKEAAAK